MNALTAWAIVIAYQAVAILTARRATTALRERWYEPPEPSTRYRPVEPAGPTEEEPGDKVWAALVGFGIGQIWPTTLTWMLLYKFLTGSTTSFEREAALKEREQAVKKAEEEVANWVPPGDLKALEAKDDAYLKEQLASHSRGSLKFNSSASLTLPSGRVVRHSRAGDESGCEFCGPLGCKYRYGYV